MNLSWLILGILVIIVVLLLEFKDIKHRLFFFAVVGVISFFALTFIYVCYKGDVNITSFEGIVSAGKLYLSWLDGFFGNLGKVSGYVIKQNWGMNATGVAG